MENEAELRAQAVKRLQQRRDFFRHLTVYVLVNALLVVIWFVTGRGGGYFWPIWPLLGWGVGLGVHAWSALGPGARPISEAEIQQEMDRYRRPPQ